MQEEKSSYGMEKPFDQMIERRNHFATKWCEMGTNFGADDLIPLWVADMDFAVAPPIKKAIMDMADHGIFGYMYRPSTYYEAIVAWYQRRHHWQIKPEWLIYSPGVIASLSILIQGLSQVDDKVVIQPPVYHPFYQKIVELNRRVIKNPLLHGEDKGYQMDFDGLESLFKTERPKLFILCNPHNPVGRVWPREDLERLGALCIAYKVRIISDEIHCDLVQKPHKHIPIASLSEPIAQQVVTLSAPTKTFNLAGLNTSFVICTNPMDMAIMDEGLQHFDLKRNNSFSLVATEAAYREGEPWLEAVLDYIQSNAQWVESYCKAKIPQVTIAPLEGTYLLWLRTDAYIADDEDLFRRLVAAGLAINRGIMFGEEGSGHIRINLACPRHLLEQAMPRLQSALLG